MTNVGLLRSVDALEEVYTSPVSPLYISPASPVHLLILNSKVRSVQEEELERMSIRYEEAMFEQGRANGKSALELKELRYSVFSI